MLAQGELLYDCASACLLVGRVEPLDFDLLDRLRGMQEAARASVWMKYLYSCCSALLCARFDINIELNSGKDVSNLERRDGSFERASRIGARCKAMLKGRVEARGRLEASHQWHGTCSFPFRGPLLVPRSNQCILALNAGGVVAGRTQAGRNAMRCGSRRCAPTELALCVDENGALWISFVPWVACLLGPGSCVCGYIKGRQGWPSIGTGSRVGFDSIK